MKPRQRQPRTFGTAKVGPCSGHVFITNKFIRLRHTFFIASLLINFIYLSNLVPHTDILLWYSTQAMIFFIRRSKPNQIKLRPENYIIRKQTKGDAEEDFCQIL